MIDALIGRLVKGHAVYSTWELWTDEHWTYHGSIENVDLNEIYLVLGFAETTGNHGTYAATPGLCVLARDGTLKWAHLEAFKIINLDEYDV